ncbi:MAG: hypothetical protein ABIM30_00525 [candidate division WOR-3 bacterium]
MQSVNAQKILKYALEGKFSNGSIKMCIKELLQNSRRAGAKNVRITINDNYLTYEDDGAGVSNWISIITLGDSGWDADILGTEDPAGFGLFSLYASANTIKIRSGNNEAVFVPARLIEDEYFSKLSQKINSFNKLGYGFYLEADLKNQIDMIELNELKEDVIKYFYMIDRIILNGEEVKRIDINDLKSRAYKVIQYKGNDIIISKNAILRCASHAGALPIKVLWHGEVIETEKFSLALDVNECVLFVIESGNPIDISLPYREGIVLNEKYKKFEKFVKEKIKGIINECLKSLKKGIYNISGLDLSSEFTMEQKIAIKHMCKTLGPDVVVVDVYHVDDSLYYPSFSFLVYGKSDIKEVERSLSNVGVYKIGMLDLEISKNFDEYQEIQYPDNDMVYRMLYDPNVVKIGSIIKGIPIIRIKSNDLKHGRPYILNSNVDQVFFLFLPACEHLIPVARSFNDLKKSYNNKLRNFDILSIALKVMFFNKEANEDSSYYELARQVAKETKVMLAREFFDKNAIVGHIVNAAAEVLDKNTLKKLEKYIRGII